MSDTTDTVEATTETIESAGESSNGLTGGAHSVLLEPDHDTTPIPAADPSPVSVPLPQASTGSVDVAWEVLDVLTGPDGLL
ncbi:hypothetical protein NQ015_08305 [Corynebacterium sp. 153RC1]|uniref:Uncharacterized protein n=1 Tax=Trueperella pyogenes TaxID=1661 RepID=A0A3Q9GGA3_9ACTO|nr:MULTISPECIES: hypothetical protein [Actinomycetes]MDY5273402.1 hypothetical protein [Arcanobacterium sp.]ALD74512.1 hypothetical protein AN946_09615 [Trueperella pyogenes]AZR07242.1 hypothetical protein EBQ10_08015 [Trueperella pyogenes]MCQ9352972.1 hypothetical protein [Corynebacterium sp. 209RC1]MCQ9355135.1 hypothetical protein [Corynebacterium sp. 1222RC1]